MDGFRQVRGLWIADEHHTFHDEAFNDIYRQLLKDCVANFGIPPTNAGFDPPADVGSAGAAPVEQEPYRVDNAGRTVVDGCVISGPAEDRVPPSAMPAAGLPVRQGAVVPGRGLATRP